MLSTRISPSFEDLLQLGQADAIERRKMVKAFAAGTNAFPDRLDAWHTRPFYIAALGLVRDHLRRRFIDFKLSAHFLDLRGLFFELGRESLYLFLLLPDRCLQLFNLAIESGVGIRALGNGLLFATGSKSALIGCVGRQKDCAQPSIRIDENETRDAACIINGRTVDVVDKAPVTYLAKTTVHTRQMADYDIVIDSGKTATGLSA